MQTQRTRLFALALSLAGMVGGTARADIMLPLGGTVSLPGGDTYNNSAGSVAPGATEIASTTVAINLSPVSGLRGVTMTEEVFREAGGTLDFLYQINNTLGSESVTSIALTNFTFSAISPFTTRVGYTTTLPVQSGTALFTSPGTESPISATRTVGGGQITFNFTGVNGIAAGTLSNVFFIRTNATAYDAGGTVTANGAHSNTGVLVLEPASVPEPSSVTLLGLGAAIGLGALRRRRRVGS